MWLIKKDQRRIFDDQGYHQVVTLLEVMPAFVVGIKKEPSDGYNALVVGWGKKAIAKMKKPQREWLKKAGFKQGFKLIKEIQIEADKLQEYKVGQPLDLLADLQPGSLTKVSGKSKGRGFAGVVKRWGFRGGPRTHGQSDRERAPGSIGAGTTPGRVVKGKKMPGRYGGQIKTVLNLPVLAVDKVNGLIFVKGVIPGPKNQAVKLEVVGQKQVTPIKLASSMEPADNPEAKSDSKPNKSNDKNDKGE